MSRPIAWIAVYCLFGVTAAVEGQAVNLIISLVGVSVAAWWLWMEIRR